LPISVSLKPDDMGENDGICHLGGEEIIRSMPCRI
jgi:hypothetical protein